MDDVDGLDFAADAMGGESKVPQGGALQQGVSKWKELKQRIARLTDELKATKVELQMFETDGLVAIMDSLGQKKAESSDGSKVTIASFLQGNIPSKTKINEAEDNDERDALIERRERAIMWLRANDLGSIIASNLIIELPKGSNARPMIVEFLKANNITFTEEERVHPQTLTKSLKEVHEKGTVIPVDVFELYMGRKATVKPAKEY